MLEKTLESPLDCKEIQPVYHKGDQTWVFIGRTDVETEMPILWRSAFFIVQLSHSYTTTGKAIALNRWTFVGKVMSLLFNMLALWKKSYDQPRQHIKEQRHYFKKGPSSQSYGFSSSQYGSESWTIKKVERQRIDAFELWC